MMVSLSGDKRMSKNIFHKMFITILVFFLCLHPKYMLWVLIRIASLKQSNEDPFYVLVKK